MSLFRWNWLRKFVRRRTRPIPEDRAGLWKQRLSIAYALLAWNGFGIVCYMIYSGKGDWAKYYGLKSPEEVGLSPGQQWAKTLGIKNATVYKVSGFNVTKTAEIDEEGKMDNVLDRTSVNSSTLDE